MTPPNFPQNNWTINQQPIIYHPKNKLYSLVFALGATFGVLAVHFIIDSHKVALCDKDNSVFECFVARGEVVVKLGRDKEVVICRNLQKNYLLCLPDILVRSFIEKKPDTTTKPRQQEECLGDDCPPSDEPTPF